MSLRGGKSHKLELTVYYSGLGLGPELPGKLITAINQHHVLCILGGERGKRQKRLAEEHKFGTDDKKDLPRLS